MKHWSDALTRAREAKAFLANRGEQMCLWLAEFVLEQHEQALAHVEMGDSVQTARQLTIVQTRCTELLEQVRVLTRESTANWEDKPDEWTDAIKAAHPVRSESHDTWATAMTMVGHRHSKGALIELVNWLLQKHPRSERPSTRVLANESCSHPSPATLSGGDQSKPGAAGRIQWCETCGALRYEAMQKHGDEWKWTKWYQPLALTGDLVGAIQRAGFRVSPALLGEQTLWCVKCGRDSGFHHDTCEKAKS